MGIAARTTDTTKHRKNRYDIMYTYRNMHTYIRTKVFIELIYLHILAYSLRTNYLVHTQLALSNG